MNWPFPFSWVPYLNKNPADLFRHISGLWSCLLSSYCSSTPNEHGSSKSVSSPLGVLYHFLSIFSQLSSQASHTNKAWHAIFLREVKLFIREYISLHLTAGCQIVVFAFWKHLDKACCRRLMQQHGNNKESDTDANNWVLKGIVLIHLPLSHVTLEWM